jgi:peroxiredoxin
MAGIGDSAPDFTGNDFVHGVPFTLSDHAGKVLLLSFMYMG